MKSISGLELLQFPVSLTLGAGEKADGIGESISLFEPVEGGPKWAIITPFAHPGDLVKVRIYKHDRLHTFADLFEILEYDETNRGGEGDRRKYPSQGCKYFGEWSVSLCLEEKTRAKLMSLVEVVNSNLYLIHYSSNIRDLPSNSLISVSLALKRAQYRK